MGKNLIERMKDMKTEKAEEKRKAAEEATKKKEAEKAAMIAKLGEALVKMRINKESMQNKLLVEIQLTKKDIARRPNDKMLKNRHYQKLKMWYAFYKYSGLMLEQLELKNDEIMMGQGMAEFADVMKVTNVLISQPVEEMPDMDKLTKAIEESLQSSGKQFEGIDQLLAGATEARNKSMAIANCPDELIDGLLSGTISLDDDTPLQVNEDIPLTDDKDDVISQLLNMKN